MSHLSAVHPRHSQLSLMGGGPSDGPSDGPSVSPRMVRIFSEQYIVTNAATGVLLCELIK